ncbi:hypothetical protein BN2364_3092 [Alloalcanivorax xenomutans]|nr:hypothetical protein BN2364_3092 [Alloalcanivorax xenomutans]
MNSCTLFTGSRFYSQHLFTKIIVNGVVKRFAISRGGN